MTQLIELGAVGEIAGWAYDRQGVLIQGATNSRVAGVPLEQTAQRLIIGIAGGVKKVESILAALHGKSIARQANFKGGTSPRIYPWNQFPIENRKSSSPRIYPWGQSKI